MIYPKSGKVFKIKKAVEYSTAFYFVGDATIRSPLPTGAGS